MRSIVEVLKKKGILDKNLNVILEPAYDSLYVNEHDGHWYATLCDGQLMIEPGAPSAFPNPVG